MHFPSELLMSTTFLFVNENIKCGYAFSYQEERECDYHPLCQCKIHFIKLNRTLDYLFFHRLPWKVGFK